MYETNTGTRFLAQHPPKFAPPVRPPRVVSGLNLFVIIISSGEDPYRVAARSL